MKHNVTGEDEGKEKKVQKMLHYNSGVPEEEIEKWSYAKIIYVEKCPLIDFYPKVRK
jgi:hypothetical protein